MSSKLVVSEIDVHNKKVLLRVDFNVPIDKGVIKDDARIVKSLPTIQYLVENGAKVIIISHLGRPKTFGEKYSLKACADRLSKLISRPVQFISKTVGSDVEAKVSKLNAGDILMLENLRFERGEEMPALEPSFVNFLAQLADLYVNDAFGASHRSHGSITEITKYFPGRSAAGFLLQKEIEYLDKTLVNPKRPFVAVLGGAKISTKFKVLQSLMQKADVLMVGGAMANTFLKSEGLNIGDSLYEKDFLEVARELLDISCNPQCKIMLPVDLVVAKKVTDIKSKKTISVEKGVPGGYVALDIGPKTVQLFANNLQNAQTVFWNGPMGVFEYQPFDAGTIAMAEIVAKLKATTIVGGGDSLSALEQSGYKNDISHLSTGGGATLEYIEKGGLPGIDALSDKNDLQKNGQGQNLTPNFASIQ